MAEKMLLELGAQTNAAKVIDTCATNIFTTLQDLATPLDSAMPSFKGGAAAGLSEALNAWFATASRLPGILTAYAEALDNVDATAAKADADGTRSLAATSDASGVAGAGRGLPSGLNLESTSAS